MINYIGHSGYDMAQTNGLLQKVRGELPADTWLALYLTAAIPLGEPFDRDISRDFGIEALCKFQLQLVDKESAHQYHPAAIAALYAHFAKGHLVITWELDSIIADPNAQ
ncbi:hypothetical protein [Devosia sp. SL43]|uniref:hypothetical protein n=1 Tax=Devosia sp. SL43 TaxID=2806348 RepID=UPI001F3CB90C|nr:hypothetical protein [Devosia sp. SL43]UJW86788.1 hypothetical protein IM737_05935 [Devosia sp. SL43]